MRVEGWSKPVIHQACTYNPFSGAEVFKFHMDHSDSCFVHHLKLELEQTCV